MQQIEYGIHKTPFGYALIAVSDGAVCQIAFLEDASDAEAEGLIGAQWPRIPLRKNERKTKPYADNIFFKKGNAPIDLILKGTDFQLAVWKELLKIPEGTTRSYAQIAQKIGRPKAVRAVGSACGKNAVAYLVPCHRVRASTGSHGGYRWGVARKQELLARERKA